MLGEPLLRAASGRWRGKISVPVLLTPHGAVFDSSRIARHAERLGQGTPLFPASAEREIERWNDLSASMLVATRPIVIRNVLADREAQTEALPLLVPSALRRPLGALAVTGAKFIARKYNARSAALHDAHIALQHGLDQLRAGLAGGKRYLLNDFSYADITMAVTLQGIRPPEGFLDLGAATRAAWTDPGLAAAYPDLLAWRDEIYARHRSH